MDAVTYPEPAVAALINERYISLQLNTKEESTKPVVERYRQVWTPDLRMLDHEGFEYYRWNGYLPPFEFIPQLLVAEAQAHLRRKNVEQAAEVYQQILDRFPSSRVAPEANYYAAVANYRASENVEELMNGWERLRRRYPDSDWRLKQSFIENE